MFIRWQTRTRKESYPARQPRTWTALLATLAHNRRVDGKVRQQSLAHLGHIMDPEDVDQRRAFWRRLERKLAGTAIGKVALTDDIRNAIRAGVAKRVQRPTVLVTHEEIKRAEERVESLEWDIRAARRHVDQLEEERGQGVPKMGNRDWSLALRGSVVSTLPVMSVLHKVQDLRDEIEEILKKPSSAHASQIATGKYRPGRDWPALVRDKLKAMGSTLDGAAGKWTEDLRAGIAEALPSVDGEYAHWGEVRTFDGNVRASLDPFDRALRLAWLAAAGEDTSSRAALVISRCGHGRPVALTAAAASLKAKTVDEAEAILRAGIPGAKITFQKGRPSTGPTFRVAWSPPST